MSTFRVSAEEQERAALKAEGNANLGGYEAALMHYSNAAKSWWDAGHGASDPLFRANFYERAALNWRKAATMCDRLADRANREEFRAQEGRVN